MKMIISLLLIAFALLTAGFTAEAAQLRTIDKSAIENSVDDGGRMTTRTVSYTSIGGVKVARSSMLDQAGADWDKSVVNRWRIPEATVLVVDMVEGITSQWCAETRSDYATLIIRGVNPDHANLVIAVGVPAVDGVEQSYQIVYSNFLSDGINNSILVLKPYPVEDLKYLPEEVKKALAKFLETENGEQKVGIWSVSISFMLHPNAAAGANMPMPSINIDANKSKTVVENVRDVIGLYNDIKNFKF